MLTCDDVYCVRVGGCDVYCVRVGGCDVDCVTCYRTFNNWC